MTEPFGLACHCGFKTTEPQAFVDHCLTTGHLDIGADVETGDLAELARMFAAMQQLGANPDMELPEGVSIRPVTREDILADDDLTDEEKQDILDRFDAARRREDG